MGIKNPIKKFETNNNTAISTNIYEKYLNKPLPFEQLPDRIRIISQHVAETRGLPQDMIAMTAIGVIAGTLGDSFTAQNAYEPYTQLPNLYMFGFGATCSGKSAGMEPFLRPLRGYKNTIMERLQKGENVEIPKAFPDQFMFENGTCEGITLLMSELGTPLFGINSEGREIIDIMNGAYKKNNGTEVGFYCKAWSGEPVDSIRASKRTIKIPKAVLNILWLAQPDVFKKAFVDSENAMMSGLIGRFLFFKGAENIPLDTGTRPKENPEIMASWKKLLESLLDIRTTGNQYIVDANDAAREFFRNHHNKWVEAQNGPLKKYASAIGRAREQAIRLSISLAMAERGEITLSIAQTACAIVDYSYSVLLEALYQKELNEVQSRHKSFVDLFQERGSEQLPYGEIQRYRHCNRDQIDEVLRYNPDIFKKIPLQKGGSALRLLTKI